jgi:hypothetical protein
VNLQDDEDFFRKHMLEAAPELRADIGRMTDLFRELVNFERRKLGLDNPEGRLFLHKNLAKKLESDPDLVGSGTVAGRHYQVAAWLKSPDSLKLSLLPRKWR